MYEEICKTLPKWFDTVVGAETTDFIYKIKEKYPNYDISTKSFWLWQQEDIYPIVIDFGQVVNPQYIKKLCKKYPVYIVSNSSPNHINFYMKKLDIKPKWFKKIISNRFEEYDRTKKHYYEDILKTEKCNPENLFIYGDSLKSDLKPGMLLGAKTFLIKNANDLKKIVDDSLSLQK